MNKSIFKYIAIPAVALMAIACDKDDFTDESTLVKTNPTVSVEIPNNSASFIEKDSTFEFTITLDQPQISDVLVYVKQVGGDATEGEDFAIGTSIVKIPANRTTGVASISVKSDKVPEGTETFTIQIGDEHTGNASMTPQTVEFTIMNYTEGDLPIELSWASNFYDASGEPVSPTDQADLILYLTDENGEVVDAADGAGFEKLVLTPDLADGTYLVKAGIYSAIDPGQLGDAPVLDLTLDYSQVGEIGESTITFPAAFDTKLTCEGNLYTIAKIVKSGTNYTVTQVGEAASVDVESYVGAYEADEPGYGKYPVNFSLGTNPGELVNDNFWDAGAEVSYMLDVCGTVTIPAQAILDGAYVVTGNGIYETDGNFSQIVVDYEVRSAAGALVDKNRHTFIKQ